MFVVKIKRSCLAALCLAVATLLMAVSISHANAALIKTTTLAVPSKRVVDPGEIFEITITVTAEDQSRPNGEYRVIRGGLVGPWKPIQNGYEKINWTAHDSPIPVLFEVQFREDVTYAPSVSYFNLVIGEPIAPTVINGTFSAKFATTLPIAPDWMVRGIWDDIKIKTHPKFGTVRFERNALFYNSGFEHAGVSDQFTFTALNNGAESLEATVTVNVEPSPLTITPARLPDGKVGQPYNARLSVSGGSGSYFFFERVGGTFPKGVLRFDDGSFNGVPEESGTFSLVTNVRDLATDAVGAQRLSFTVQPADDDFVVRDGKMTVGFRSYLERHLTAFVDGDVSDFQIIEQPVNGNLTLLTGGIFSYSPNYDFHGTDSFRFKAISSSGQSGEGTISITVTPPAPPVLKSSTFDLAFNESLSVDLNTLASNYLGQLDFRMIIGPSLGSISINPFGKLTYTPRSDVSGQDRVYITASHFGIQSAPALLTFNVAKPPSPALEGAKYRAIYNLPITIQLRDHLIGVSDPSTIRFALKSTPGKGVLSMNTSSGAVSYMAHESGLDSFQAIAIDQWGRESAPASFEFEIAPPNIAVTATAIPALYVGDDVSHGFAASGGRAPYTFRLLGSVPAGLALQGDTLVGKPAAEGNFDFEVIAVDANGYEGRGSFSARVARKPINFSSTTLTSGKYGQPYDGQIPPATGGIGTISYDFRGDLPRGIALDLTTLKLIGVPNVSGSFTLALTAEDEVGTTATANFTLVIDNSAMELTPAQLSSLVPGVRFQQRFVATGGVAPYRYTASGKLPSGLSLNGDRLEGVPTASGRYIFTITALDANDETVFVGYDVQVGQPDIVFPPTKLPKAKAGVYYEAAISPATGGNAPYSYSLIGHLPDGLLFDPHNLRITGEPVTAGTFVFKIAVRDNTTDAEAVEQAFELVVDESDAPQAGNGNVLVDYDGGPTDFDLATLVSGRFDAIRIDRHPVKGVVRLEGSKAIYTPNAGVFGADNFTFIASNAGRDSSPAMIRVTISKPDAPKATGAQLSVASGGTVSVDLGNYVTGHFETIEIAKAPAKGSATINGSQLTYVAPQDAYGFDALSYRAMGPGGESVATVAVEIASPPVPEAVDHTVMLEHGKTGTVDVSEGAKGGPFTSAAIVTGPDRGSATASDTIVTFIPEAGFSGPATVKFSLSNAFGTSEIRTITFLVAERPDIARDQEVIGVLSAQVQSTRRMARDQISNFASRMEKLHSEGEGARLNDLGGIRLGFASEKNDKQEEADPFYQVDKHKSGMSPNNFVEKRIPIATGNKTAFWSGGYVNFGDSNSDDTAISSTTAGVSGGVDYRFSKSFVAGIGIGYGRDKSDVGAQGSESEAKAISAAIYGSYHPANGTFFDGLVGYSWLDFSSRRFVTPMGDYALGDRKGSQLFGSITAGYEYRQHKFLVSPYVRLECAHAKLEAFAERGGPYSVSYGEQTVSSFAGVIGGRIEYEIDSDFGRMKPSARIEYTRDFDGRSHINAGYSDIGRLPSIIEIDGSDSDRLTLGLGLDTSFENGWSLGVDYRHITSSSEHNHAIGVRLKSAF